MRHKYPTEAIVLSRSPIAEASALLTLLTRDVGLVRARAQGVRMPGAKLSGALATLAAADVVLVAGKEGWRVSGAVLRESWFQKLSHAARERAGRIATLLLRLVHGEAPESTLFDTFDAYLAALATYPEERHDALETLAALRLLFILGLDAGGIPGEDADPFAEPALDAVTTGRAVFIARVNRGIAASGL
jgi:recombinational DNA repair protein (RecF pathway)